MRAHAVHMRNTETMLVRAALEHHTSTNVAVSMRLQQQATSLHWATAGCSVRMRQCDDCARKAVYSARLLLLLDNFQLFLLFCIGKRPIFSSGLRLTPTKNSARVPRAQIGHTLAVSIIPVTVTPESPPRGWSSDAKEKFVKDFVAAWTKVMNLDRFDLMLK